MTCVGRTGLRASLPDGQKAVAGTSFEKRPDRPRGVVGARRVAKQPDVEGDLPRLGAGGDKQASVEVRCHQRFGQPRDAVTGARPHAQRTGHGVFVDRAQTRLEPEAGQRWRDQGTDRGGVTKSKKRRGLRRCKVEYSASVRRGLGHGDQPIPPNEERRRAAVRPGIRRLIGDDKIHLPAFQILQAVRQIIRTQPRQDWPVGVFQRLQPAGVKTPPDGVLRAKRDDIAVRQGLGFEDLTALLLDTVERLMSGVELPLTRFVQPNGLPRPIHQNRTDPAFERFDAPRKGRLAQVPQGRGLGKISGLVQPLKIAKQGDVHDSRIMQILHDVIRT